MLVLQNFSHTVYFHKVTWWHSHQNFYTLVYAACDRCCAMHASIVLSSSYVTAGGFQALQLIVHAEFGVVD